MTEKIFRIVQQVDIQGIQMHAGQGAGNLVFDEFRMEDGRKSLAISVRLQPTEKTLTDEDIEAVGAKIVAKVEKATGGSLRG